MSGRWFASEGKEKRQRSVGQNGRCYPTLPQTATNIITVTNSARQITPHVLTRSQRTILSIFPVMLCARSYRHLLNAHIAHKRRLYFLFLIHIHRSEKRQYMTLADPLGRYEDGLNLPCSVGLYNFSHALSRVLYLTNSQHANFTSFCRGLFRSRLQGDNLLVCTHLSCLDDSDTIVPGTSIIPVESHLIPFPDKLSCES